jgi:hypothetical protein
MPDALVIGDTMGAIKLLYAVTYHKALYARKQRIESNYAPRKTSVPLPSDNPSIVALYKSNINMSMYLYLAVYG